MSAPEKYGLAGRIARPFLRSKLTPVVVFASILLGLAAVGLTPREEEPQIVVPMVDVMVPMPGASPSEVESQVVTPLERRLWGIPGVEYLYSSSRTDGGFITVRFKVNEPLEPSLVKVRQEIDAHPELLPAGAVRPTVRALTIDDVPFLTVTLHAAEPMAPGALRALADEVAREIAAVPQTAQVSVVGGARRVVRVEPDPERLRTPDRLAGRAAAGARLGAGPAPRRRAGGRRAARAGRGARVRPVGGGAEPGGGRRPRPAAHLPGGRGAGGGRARARAGRGPDRLERAARRSSRRPASPSPSGPGTNATELGDAVLAKVQALRGRLIPASVEPPSPATTARPPPRSRTS